MRVLPLHGGEDGGPLHSVTRTAHSVLDCLVISPRFAPIAPSVCFHFLPFFFYCGGRRRVATVDAPAAICSGKISFLQPSGSLCIIHAILLTPILVYAGSPLIPTISPLLWLPGLHPISSGSDAPEVSLLTLLTPCLYCLMSDNFSSGRPRSDEETSICRLRLMLNRVIRIYIRISGHRVWTSFFVQDIFGVHFNDFQGVGGSHGEDESLLCNPVFLASFSTYLKLLIDCIK